MIPTRHTITPVGPVGASRRIFGRFIAVELEGKCKWNFSHRGAKTQRRTANTIETSS
jgi:hypothetical protein